MSMKMSLTMTYFRWSNVIVESGLRNGDEEQRQWRSARLRAEQRWPWPQVTLLLLLLLLLVSNTDTTHCVCTVWNYSDAFGWSGNAFGQMGVPWEALVYCRKLKYIGECLDALWCIGMHKCPFLCIWVRIELVQLYLRASWRFILSSRFESKLTA